MPDRTIKTDQAAFMEMLHSVSEIVKNMEQPLSKTELMEYFKNMELSAEQQDLIYQYFQKDVSDTLQPGGQELVSLAETGKKAAENKKKRPESAFFQMYLKDLQSIMPCTVQEEERLYAKLAAGDETAVRKLSEQWMLRTLPLAEQYAAHAGHLEDLIQEGNMGIFLCLQDMLGYGRTMNFQKELENAAVTAMKAYLDEEMAVKTMDDSLLARTALVYEAQKYLAAELCRMPSAQELSQYTKLKETEIEDILSIMKEKK